MVTKLKRLTSLKKFKLKKIGTVLTVLVFGVVSFTAGVDLTNKANSATSASVLPINKGGTGANNASGAATNILGTNFGNYSGVLPITKGGTGINIVPSPEASTIFAKTQAQRNLNNVQRTMYRFYYVANSAPKYIKLAQTAAADAGNDNRDIVALITGLDSTVWGMPFTYMLSVGKRYGQGGGGAQANIVGLSLGCTPKNNFAYVNIYNNIRTVYFKQITTSTGASGSEPVTLNFIKEDPNEAFAQETLDELPTNGTTYEIPLNCVSIATPPAS
jgi:hypothetical protein